MSLTILKKRELRYNDLMKEFRFELKSGEEKVMDINELTRWACLLEGIEQVEKHYEEIGKSIE